MARILLVGTATLDLVFELEHHPASDEEMRAASLRTCRGGNAANTAVVLAGLEHAPEFFGVLAIAPETAVIEEDFENHGVAFTRCPRLPGRPPTSSIYLARAERSIVHYRDLPELSAGQFLELDLSGYDWLHFEGRNVEQLARMMMHARTTRPDLPLSLELEKPRDGIQSLLALPDLILCSRGFARHSGFEAPQDFLRWMRDQAPQATVLAPWGEAGAYGLDAANSLCHAPARPPAQVIDTLGAGDTFNAAAINALLQNKPLQDVLEQGCRLAGRKCGIYGFDL